MILPENGSVVIIDDQPQEALPLIEAFSKKGISTTYYKGYNKADLPDTSLQRVRLVILDLQLFAGVTDPKTISANLVSILVQILGKRNGPYILLVWSQKESMYSSEFITEVNKPYHEIVPALIVSLPKKDCLVQQNSLDATGIADDIIGEIAQNLEEDTDKEKLKAKIASLLNTSEGTMFVARPDAVENIEKAINKELVKAGTFHLFVVWENLIKRSSAKIVSEIFTLVQFNEKWELNARDIFRRMGVARVGQNVVDNNELIRESIATLNNSFIDTLELELRSVTIPSYIDIKSDTLMVIKRDNKFYSLVREADGLFSIFRDENRLAKDKSPSGATRSIVTNNKISDTEKKHCGELISLYEKIPNALNTRLHIEMSPSQELIPGNIYIHTTSSDDKKRQYLSTYFRSLDSLEKYFLIDLEVSPICDYAQNKWHRSRVLPGVIYPLEFESALKSTAGYFCDIQPVFEINGGLYKIRFDHRLFNALDKSNQRKREVKYRLKREVLTDIISQLSFHVQRSGITYVS